MVLSHSQLIIDRTLTISFSTMYFLI